ncbi:hypothetical protein [Varunaivibrio sulfuroxidans]|uniref:Uncharacterized protein n=1 Tax=Varunaivibrio sulfuroxidans TaxID=1773489 RepID=A0A4V2UNW0_9PROT|nr:hypothetical protein [Varunaivibrio sulfuroxidans]TCS63581.1 hypothetical protein EDD55_103204 [Varunaivibrio sulfuroxidans]WES30276.1 hypothetical protein P3M64_11625 [Varunaivibrio sulfuroxidans]
MKTSPKNALVTIAILAGAAPLAAVPALASDNTTLVGAALSGQSTLMPSSEHVTHAQYFARIRQGAIHPNAKSLSAMVASTSTYPSLMTSSEHKGHAHYFSEIGLKISRPQRG